MIPAGAIQQLRQLYRIDPGHSRLGDLERLLEADQAGHTSVMDPLTELIRLCEGIQPLAEDLLGG